MARAFGESHATILAGLQATQARAEATDPFFEQALPFPPDSFFERRAVRRAAEACPAVLANGEALQQLAGTPIADAMQALGRFLGHLEDAEAFGLARVRPVAQLLAGICRFPGGAEGVREVVRERLGSLGGDLLGDEKDPAELEEVIFDGGRFCGVKVAGNSHVYRADCLLVGMDVGSLAAVIPPKVKRRGLSGLLGSVRVRRHIFTINLVVREEGLPLGLKSFGLVHPGDEVHGPVLLEVMPSRKKGRDVPGEKVLCASAFVPHGEHSNSDERIRAIGKRIEAAVTSVTPFIEPHVVARSLPYRDARNLKGTPLLYHPLLEVDTAHDLGIAGLPHRTPCKNLFLASHEVIPGLGIEGEFLAALRAAALVQGVLKRHDPLK